MPGGSKDKKGAKRGAAELVMDKYSLGQYVDKTVVLDADMIKIDRDGTKGQIRVLNQCNVDDLIRSFENNEPDEVILTVVKDRGVFHYL